MLMSHLADRKRDQPTPAFPLEIPTIKGSVVIKDKETLVDVADKAIEEITKLKDAEKKLRELEKSSAIGEKELIDQRRQIRDMTKQNEEIIDSAIDGLVYELRARYAPEIKTNIKNKRGSWVSFKTEKAWNEFVDPTNTDFRNWVELQYRTGNYKRLTLDDIADRTNVRPKIGKGKRDGINESQLRDIADSLGLDINVVVVGRGEKLADGMNIVNTYTDESPDGHWVSVYLNRPRYSVEYFDPLGELPNKKIQSLIVDSLASEPMLWKFKVNTVKHQDDTDDRCGLFALRDCLDIKRGKDFSERTGYDALVAAGQTPNDRLASDIGEFPLV
jgi:hypothetical protein